MLTIGRSATLAAATLLVGAWLSPACADGYPPFYGYSGYFGGPATYFTRESDVQPVTADGADGFPKRTYYRGGPFWTYQPSGRKSGTLSSRERRRSHRAAVLRRKG